MQNDFEFLSSYLARLVDLPDFAGIELAPATANHLGDTPLHIAAIRNECEAIVALWRAGAALDAHGERGYTPLHEAAAQGHVAAVGVLVALGAATDALTDVGETPIDVALLGGHASVVECLRRKSERSVRTTTPLLREITGYLEQCETSAHTIARDTVLRWSATRDIDELGALCRLIQTPNVTIEPPLSFADFTAIQLPYLRRCLNENPSSEWAESRYQAAWAFRHWFAWLWRGRVVSVHELTALKDWLRRVYEAGDEATRECIANATLEPLFEDVAIAYFFDDWRSSPVAADAYESASAQRERLPCD